MMQPGRIVVPVHWQIYFENGAIRGNVSLEAPGLFLSAIPGNMTLDLVGDDPARIGPGWFNNFSSKIIVEDSPLPQRLIAHILILDGVLMSIRADAPGMKVVQLFILGVMGNNLCILAATGAQDLKHAPFPLGSLTGGGHGDQAIIEQYHRTRIGGVDRRLARRSLNDPIRKDVGRKSGARRAGENDHQGKRRKPSPPRHSTLPPATLPGVPTWPEAVCVSSSTAGSLSLPLTFS